MKKGFFRDTDTGKCLTVGKIKKKARYVVTNIYGLDKSAFDATEKYYDRLEEIDKLKAAQPSDEGWKQIADDLTSLHLNKMNTMGPINYPFETHEIKEIFERNINPGEKE